jgi:hypothetical protein
MSLYSKSDYVRTERRTHHAIRHALECARNRNKVMDRRGRIVCCDYELAAVDLCGRLKWTEALCDELESFFELDRKKNSADRSFFWFCCAESECAAGTYARPTFNPLTAIDHYRRGLRGLNYIAMLEPVIYSSTSCKRPSAFKDLFRFEKLVSWHIHGITWGDNRKEQRSHFNDIEAQQIYVPVVPNLKGCWAKFAMGLSVPLAHQDRAGFEFSPSATEFVRQARGL